MSIKALKNFIDNRNRFEAIFNGETKLMPKTREECEYWFNILSGELSPENLHCDGEISASAARKKYNHFMAAWRGLEKIYGESVTEDDVYRWWRERRAS